MRHKPDELAAYAAAGCDLIPLKRWDMVDRHGRRRGKSPRDVDWRARDYSSFDAAAHMATGGNVGVRLRACDLVIDVDPRNFEPGDDPIARLAADASLDLGRLPRIETGSGGSHYYMRKPPEARVRDTLKEYPGVEFKTLGRQAVAAGSLHPDTARAYEWDWLSAPLDRAAQAPQALLAMIERPAAKGIEQPGQHTPDEIARMLDGLDPADFRDHERWLQLMMACHHASHGDARVEFVEWSTRDPLYATHAVEIGRRWDSLHAGGANRITYRTLYLHLKEAGALGLVDKRATYDFPEDIEEVRQ